MRRDKKVQLPGDKPWPHFWTWLKRHHPLLYEMLWIGILGIAAIPAGISIALSIFIIAAK